MVECRAPCLQGGRAGETGIGRDASIGPYWVRWDVGPLACKVAARVVQDGGVRVPLAVCRPGRTEPESSCSVPVTSPDLYPTILEILGVDGGRGEAIDGTSLVPLLRGGDVLPRKAIFWHYPHYGDQGGTPGSSVRSGDWKLIEYHEDGRLELYNLAEDIGETNDRSTRDPGVADDLRRRLHDWQKRVEARFPEPNPEYTQESEV